MRYEDMTVEGRMAARRLHDKLCEMTAEYKGVRVEMCVKCMSRCEYGKELLEAMGMKQEETVRRERLYTDPVLGQGARRWRRRARGCRWCTWRGQSRKASRWS